MTPRVAGSCHHYRRYQARGLNDDSKARDSTKAFSRATMTPRVAGSYHHYRRYQARGLNDDSLASDSKRAFSFSERGFGTQIWISIKRSPRACLL